MIRILYFASLRERLDSGGESLELPAGITQLGQLASLLAARGPVWADVFAGRLPLMMAVNQSAARPDSPLQDGDEVAFFPPVTGG